MGSETLQDAVTAFQSWRRARGYAETTQHRDNSTLDRFVASVGGHIKVQSLGTSHVDDFFAGRHALSPQTQNTDLATFRSFFRFLETRGLHKSASMLLADYRNIKYARPPRRRVPVGEFPALLDAAEFPRDRALIAVGLYLFLRSSEIKRLKIKDLNLPTGEVGVSIPKTKDSDVMPISAELERELRWWLVTYQDQCGGALDPEWFLIPHMVPVAWDRTDDGTITKPSAYELVPTKPVPFPERVVKRALVRGLGWPDSHKEGVHTLRRSGARALYDELAASDGHSNALETVSAMLHHAVMATTQIYLGLTESRRKRDRLIKGQNMFPSLAGTEVISLPTRQDVAHG